MDFKNKTGGSPTKPRAKTGFLLLEALLAIAIVALMLVPALSLLTKSLERVNKHLWEFRRLFFAQQFMSEMSRKQQDDTKKMTETKKVQKPPTELVYTLGPVAEKSQLAEFEGLYKEEVIARGSKKESVVRLVQFIYKPDEQKEKEE